MITNNGNAYCREGETLIYLRQGETTWRTRSWLWKTVCTK